MSDYRLLESGDRRLLESDGFRLLESGTLPDPNPITATIREYPVATVMEGRKMPAKVTYNRDAERPSLALWVLDRAGTLIDFSSGYTFSFKIGSRGATGALTKTTGITGATGSGTAPTGTPNVAIDWTAGDLDITPGTYLWQLTATNGGLDRVYEGTFVVLDAID